MLGSMAMQFRSWMPQMVQERFGKLKYDQDLEVHTMGKFNLFFLLQLLFMIKLDIFISIIQPFHQSLSYNQSFFHLIISHLFKISEKCGAFVEKIRRCCLVKI